MSRFIILGLLVLVCLGLSTSAGLTFFARKAYSQGCKEEASRIIDAFVGSDLDREASKEQVKQFLFNECEEKAKGFSLKEFL